METLRSESKTSIRRLAMAHRDALGAGERAEASAQIVERLVSLMSDWTPASVAGYAPIHTEVDVLPVLNAASAMGCITGLPAIAEQKLVFRRWYPGQPLEVAALGFQEPPTDAETIAPDVIFVPIVGFDRRCGRLGYGHGYYDRAIKELVADGARPKLVGTAFAAQEVDRVPVEQHDVRLEMIVTEQETIAANGAVAQVSRAGA